MASSQPWLTTQPRRLAGFLVMNYTNTNAHTHNTHFWFEILLSENHPLLAVVSSIKITRTETERAKKHFSANNRAEALMALWMVQTKRRSVRVMKQVSRVLVLFTVTESCVSFVPQSVQYCKSTLWSTVVLWSHCHYFDLSDWLFYSSQYQSKVNRNTSALSALVLFVCSSEDRNMNDSATSMTPKTQDNDKPLKKLEWNLFAIEI